MDEETIEHTFFGCCCLLFSAFRLLLGKDKIISTVVLCQLLWLESIINISPDCLLS